MNQALNLLKNLGLMYCCVALPAWAVGAPDAGTIQNQIEQTLRPPAAPPVSPLKPAHVDSSPASGVMVTVTGFDFVGNTLIPTDVLAGATQQYLDRPLTLAQLREAGDVVQQLYKDAGWMVQVHLPPQEIDRGRVKISVVEARLGKIIWVGKAERVKAEVLDALVRAQLRVGEPVRQDRLERALLLLNDLPGVSSSASFSQGEKAGQTDLVIEVADKSMYSGSMGLDNMGSSVTGTSRATANLNINSPFALGDLISISALYTEGSHYGRLGYGLPIGNDGWRAGAHVTEMGYSAVSGAQSFKGNANTLGLDWSYPLLRSQQQNLTFNGSWDKKKFRNINALDGGSDFGIQVGLAGLTANVLDAWAGGGANNAALTLTSGQVKANTQLSDPSTAGQFTKWLLSLSRVQTVTSNLSATVSGQVQRANKNLDSSEKLYLGGAYGVRAYPNSEGGVSDGQTLTAEFNYKLDAALTTGVFYDYGHGDNPAVPALSSTMKGPGLSVTWQPVPSMLFKAIAAHRVGDVQNTTSIYSANRFWLSAQYFF